MPFRAPDVESATELARDGIRQVEAEPHPSMRGFVGIKWLGRAGERLGVHAGAAISDGDHQLVVHRACVDMDVVFGFDLKGVIDDALDGCAKRAGRGVVDDRFGLERDARAALSG